MKKFSIYFYLKMNQKFSNLNKAYLTSDYLETNSLSHNFVFGALAEIIDNSRDADAKSLKIYTEYNKNFRGCYLLCFLDDGTGMSYEETVDSIKFGKSKKKFIGLYGNGLKSGSMRIGNDLLIFTKQGSIAPILLLSTSFLKNERIEEIYVPLLSYNLKNKVPVFDLSHDDLSAIEKFENELEIIYKYSPYKDFESIIKQFEKIDERGTLIQIYNLKISNQKTELDFETDPGDILIRDCNVDPDRNIHVEHCSLRAYVSILYDDPRMKIYIQNKKVETNFLKQSLYLPRMMTYESNKLKYRAIEERERTLKELEKAQNYLKEITLRLSNFLNLNKCRRADYYYEFSTLTREKEEAEKDLREKEEIFKNINNKINNSTKLEFIFGINVHNRSTDGLFIYNGSRLIIMYEQTKTQKKNSNYRGIVGIVNVPYFFLKPSNNKQSFCDSSEQNELLRVLGEYMDSYYDFLEKTHIDKKFWSELGYFDNKIEQPPNKEKYTCARFQKSKYCIQCDKCLKWRKFIINPNLIIDSFLKDNWSCDDNMDIRAKSCDVPENLEKFTELEYKKPKKNKFISTSTEKDCDSSTEKKRSPEK